MNNELYHYGVVGMKWGVRRYQNPDGSLTSKGRKRYGIASDGSMSEKGIRNASKDVKKAFKSNRVSVFSSEKSQSFGKNTDEVLAKYKAEANSNKYEVALNKMDVEGRKLYERYKNDPNNEKIHKEMIDFKKKYDETVYKNTQEGHKIAQKYISAFNEATVKDLGIPNYKEVSKYITDNNMLWDTTYISNYAWFDKLF